jgi:hypothetical protein
MQKIILITFLLWLAGQVSAQGRFSNRELSVNLFRNPSIGLEYRYRHVSVHAGYYVTNFESNTTWQFVKTGVTCWFLPVGHKENPSSFYAQLSYLRGLNRDYKGLNASALDIGFRWIIWKGLHTRLGVNGLLAPGKALQINPTPSIGYSFFFQ